MLTTGRLVVREPLRPLGEPKRRLLVTPEIDRLLDGQPPSTGFPRLLADELVGRYLAGHLVTASLTGTSGRHVVFERLRNVDEVWALCFRQPRPGWRVLGRFYAQGVFVGLRAYDRHDLAGSRYRQRADEIPGEWAAPLGSAEPVRGSDVGAYLGGVWRDADEPL